MKRPKSKSPGAGTVSESDAPSPGPSMRRDGSEVDGGSDSEEDEDVRVGGAGGGRLSSLAAYATRRAASEGLELDESERDLAARLELARKNSRNQHDNVGVLNMDGPTEETIYEGDYYSKYLTRGHRLTLLCRPSTSIISLKRPARYTQRC